MSNHLETEAVLEARRLTEEREHTHGNYAINAEVSVELMNVITEKLIDRIHKRGLPELTPTQTNSLFMIMQKIGRIIAGDPSFQDHWDDIAGYAHIANEKP